MSRRDCPVQSLNVLRQELTYSPAGGFCIHISFTLGTPNQTLKLPQINPSDVEPQGLNYEISSLSPMLSKPVVCRISFFTGKGWNVDGPEHQPHYCRQHPHLSSHLLCNPPVKLLFCTQTNNNSACLSNLGSGPGQC